MDNVLASKVLMRHLPEIEDDAYKTALEIAIETLLFQAKQDWEDYYRFKPYLDLFGYLDITQAEYEYWLMGKRE